MTEDQKRRWDAYLGLVAPLLTVAAILIGVWQFNEGEENRRQLEETSAYQKDDIEFRRKLWLEQLESCRKIADIAGVIASSSSTETARSEAISHFRASYWGAMIINEDKRVETAMIDLEAELRDLSHGDSDGMRVKVRVASLGSACRTSLRAGTPKALAVAKP